MRKLQFSEELFEQYYNSYFKDDLALYFKINRVGQRMVVNRLRERGREFTDHGNILKRHETIPAVLAAQGVEFPEPKLPDGTLEEEFLFIAAVSFFFAVQDDLFKTNIHLGLITDCMNDFGIPFFSAAVGRDYSLYDFLEMSVIIYYVHFDQAVVALNEAFDVVKKCLLPKLTHHLHTWDVGEFDIKEIDSLPQHIDQIVQDGLKLLLADINKR